jgi:hypothetical protein
MSVCGGSCPSRTAPKPAGHSDTPPIAPSGPSSRDGQNVGEEGADRPHLTPTPAVSGHGDDLVLNNTPVCVDTPSAGSGVIFGTGVDPGDLASS